MLRRIESGPALVSLLGAFLWAMVAVLAGMRRAPFGIIELLFLFAVLVVVPLGLELARLVSTRGDTYLASAARSLQLFAAFAVVGGFWLPPGHIAAAVSVPWVVFALILAISGIVRLFPRASRSSANLIVSVAYFDLAVGSGWFLLSRAGVRPMGFLEPVVLLTAVHFHFSGFAIALIAASALRLFDEHGVDSTGLRRVVWLVVVLPFVLALGITFWPLLRLFAALALSASVMALAALLFWLSAKLRTRTARVFLRVAGSAVFVALGLACAYAVADYTGKPFLSMPGMAITHGVLNGLGFVLLATLACLIELHPVRGNGSNEIHPYDPILAHRVPDALGSDVPRKHPAAVNRELPEFVARDFYDR